MKFLCDVHISYGLVNYFHSEGIEATHVNKVLDGYFTTDKAICNFADENDYVVISKDADFKNSFLINHTPRKLIKINLGNLSNIQLVKVFTENIEAIVKLDKLESFMVEVDFESITFIKGN